MQKGTQLKKMKVVLYAFCVLFLLITFKLLYEQFFNHEYILERAENLWQRDFKISGKRGTIYTKDEEVLAINMPSTSVVVVPLMIKDYEKTANILSNILECDEQALLEKIKKRVSTQKLQPEGRNISDEQRNEILKANLEGWETVQSASHTHANQTVLDGITAEEMQYVTIAYEPIWAIGTGKTPTTDDAITPTINPSNNNLFFK